MFDKSRILPLMSIIVPFLGITIRNPNTHTSIQKCTYIHESTIF